MLRNWKSLPAERQGELRDAMREVARLSVELSGALRDRNGRSDRAMGDIVAELAAGMQQLQTAEPELGAGLELRTRRAKLAMRTARSVGGSVTRRAATLRRHESDDRTESEEPGTSAELDEVAAAFASLAENPSSA